MIHYIIPPIIRYKNIDNFFKGDDKSDYLYDNRGNISIDELLQETFTCVVGEPGIGKSRLVYEINKKSSQDIITYRASEFEIKFVPKGIKLCIIDALDEVEGNAFFNTLQTIKEYKERNPKTKVLFTCRKHYVTSHSQLFTSCKNLIYVELCRLSNEDVMKIVKGCSKNTQESILKSPKLKELITIPRYLSFLLEHERQKGECSNIGELFDFIIASSIHNSINAHQDIIKNESLKILIQRALEKVAFVMEISRKDQISKDELYTILDGVKGNMTQMLVANFDLLFFESRILKESNGILQFENTELQEYLAAKELCRLGNIESVLYDVAIQKDLKHIYPNWYDVIPHISYNADHVHSFINLFSLIVSYESNLESESFETLLRYTDSTLILPHQKQELFSLILEHYLRFPTYIRWKSSILNLMQECYTSSSNNRLMPSVESLNKIQLSNIYAILEVIVAEDKLDETLSEYWIKAANYLIHKNDDEKQLVALNLFSLFNDKEDLLRMIDHFYSFSKDVKDRFIEVTGYGKFTDKSIVDCWLNGCFERDPNAINAVLYIEDLTTMTYAYQSIIKAQKLREFFSPKGALSVFYEFKLKKQFDIAWNEKLGCKEVIAKIIANFVIYHSYSDLIEIEDIIKQIIFEEKTRTIFINCFDDHEWDLEKLFNSFDPKFIDVELISILDRLLSEKMKNHWVIDYILTSLINKIRNDEGKKASLSKYISHYAETFDRWDRNAIEEEKKRQDHSSFVLAYQSLSDIKVSKNKKILTAFELCKNIELIGQQDTHPLEKVIGTFFDEIDLDDTNIEKKKDNSFSLSLGIAIIPSFVKAMYQLGNYSLLEKHRMILAKTLPIACFTRNFDASEMRIIYKSIIGEISEREKNELVKWWKSRNDDFINISSDDIVTLITNYDIDALSFKLEEYIDEYIKNENLNYKHAASQALTLISEGYRKWDIKKYKQVFNALKDGDIDSIKMQCNAILIEKYQDAEAIEWRIDYLKNHVVESLNNDTGHARAISTAESEMISSNPKMFRCFMVIKGNDKLDEQMYDLFEFALNLCIKPDTKEYSSYLLNQIYLFFVTTSNDAYSIISLRGKVEEYNKKYLSYLPNNIMNKYELMYLNRTGGSITKAIKQYNKCIEESHLDIRNDGDLRRYFSLIHLEVQTEIQDQGIYSLVRQESLSEDFIQRELKNTIINKCCQMGLETIQVDREVTLQDNKRTDLLFRYGMCNPIMLELKLLHNTEIQNDEKRQDYKKKFIQYSKATNACLSIFWVFNVHKEGSDIAKFNKLEVEYKELDNTKVLLTDCKCSSGFETGIPQKTGEIKKRSKKKRKGEE